MNTSFEENPSLQNCSNHIPSQTFIVQVTRLKHHLVVHCSQNLHISPASCFYVANTPILKFSFQFVPPLTGFTDLEQENHKGYSGYFKLDILSGVGCAYCHYHFHFYPHDKKNYILISHIFHITSCNANRTFKNGIVTSASCPKDK